MAYATVPQLRVYIPQVADTVAYDVALADVLDRATAIVERELGFAFGTQAAGTSVVYGDGTDYLKPPAFVTGSVTSVTAPSGYTVPDYVAVDGILVVTRDGRVRPSFYHSTLSGTGYNPAGGWLPGVPYTVAATYGYDAVPDDIVEATLEIAADLWRFKDAGSIKTVGVEGAGVVRGGALPVTAKRILDSYGRSSAGGVH